jgi:hypothetical protein
MLRAACISPAAAVTRVNETGSALQLLAHLAAAKPRNGVMHALRKQRLLLSSSV